MLKMTPCPSPRGTNRERLFLMRVPGPTMAMDEELSYPQDTGNNDDTNAAGVRGVAAQSFADLQNAIQSGAPVEETMACLMRFVDDMTSEDAPIAGDSRRGTAMATDAMIRRRVAQGAQVRARLAMAQRADLIKRFPGLSNARVI